MSFISAGEIPGVLFKYVRKIGEIIEAAEQRYLFYSVAAAA